MTPEAVNHVAEYWEGKRLALEGRNPLDCAQGRRRQRAAVAWILANMDLRPFRGRIPTVDELERRKRAEG